MENHTRNFNPYLTLASQLFDLVKPFSVGDRGKNLPTDYGDHFKTAIDNFEKQALLQNLPDTDVAYVKYALVSLVDELISTSAWEQRYQWMGQPLQLQYFNEHLAGEGFFKRLADLRQSGSQYVHILEVYYTCIQLGFSGMYGINEHEKLLALTVELKNYLTMASGASSRKLSTAITKINKLAGNMGRKLPFWIVGSVTGVLLLLIYLGYSIAIDHHANVVLKTINSREFRHE
jgi:type VI secretion system protein ImpK